MSGLDRLSGLTPLPRSAHLSERVDRCAEARTLVGIAIGAVGHRALAWVARSAPGDDSASRAWTSASTTANDFCPDPRELARRGDVYDLRGLAHAIGRQTGATPTAEGELRRALQEFAREAVIQVACLSGAGADRQIAGMRDALRQALAIDAGTGVGGIVDRLAVATDSLRASHRG